MDLNAVARTFNVSKKTVIDWEDRLGELKPVLRLSAWLHQLIESMIEGDELYTLVEKNEPPALSQGWRIVSRDLRRLPRTLVLQDKSTRKTPPSRFLWELHCGWVIHNFVRVHFTTKVVPAVKLGLLETGISRSQLFSIRSAL